MPTTKNPAAGKPEPDDWGAADSPNPAKANEPNLKTTKPSKGEPGTKAPDTKAAANPQAAKPDAPNGQGDPSSIAAIFAKRDQDGDGKLTGNEITARMRRDLEAIDRDKNGEITSEEFQAFFQQFTQRPSSPSSGDAK